VKANWPEAAVTITKNTAADSLSHRQERHNNFFFMAGGSVGDDLVLRMSPLVRSSASTLSRNQPGQHQNH
jgi:hypothetical protein